MITNAYITFMIDVHAIPINYSVQFSPESVSFLNKYDNDLLFFRRGCYSNRASHLICRPLKRISTAVARVDSALPYILLGCCEIIELIIYDKL